MNKARIAEHVQSRYQTLRSNQQEIFDKVEQYKAMYHCDMTPDEAYPWEFQLTDTQIFPAVRAYLARMNPAEARISLSGQSEYRLINQQIVNWELNEILITQLIYKIMYSGLMAGHGYAKTGWFYKPALKIQSDRGEIIMRAVQNRADAKFVRFNDLFIPNRNITDIREQSYLVERLSMRFGDLLDDQEQTGRWDEDALSRIKEKRLFDNKISYGVDLPQDDDYSDNASGKADDIESVILRSQNVNMLRMTTLDNEEFYTLEQDEKLILNKNTTGEYWHGHYDYIDFVPFPEDDEFFSMGLPHSIADLEIALSSTLNQLLTNGRKAGNDMWMVGESGKQVPDWMFVNRPNGIVRVRGALSEYQRLESSNSASAEMRSLRSELVTTSEKTSGISSLYSSGVSGTSVNQTATGANIISNNIDQNLQLIISLFGAQVLKQVGEHFLELNMQYITEEQTFEITGKHGKDEYVTATPEMVSTNFKVKASPERLLKSSPAVRLSSLQNTTTMLTNQKAVQVNLKPLYEQTIAETPGLEDIDPETIIIDPEKKANEVITAIARGLEPEKALWDDDHKAMIAIIQRHLIDQPYNNEIVGKFVDYIQDLQKWIDAKNPQMLTPKMQPTDPAALAQATTQQTNPNPTASLPVQMTQEQLM